MFEVINGEEAGYIAIDDISYITCADQEAGQTCSSQSFTCGDKQCIFFDEVSKMSSKLRNCMFWLKYLALHWF